MNDIILTDCCRLCLKESFTLSDVYSDRSPSGDLIYEVLNFIYGLNVYRDDGLSSKICSPCVWRMIEFEACKKNVHHAKAEMLKIIGYVRNGSAESVKVSSGETYDRKRIEVEDAESEELSMPVINKADAESSQENETCSYMKEISVKDEIEIEEWTIPEGWTIPDELSARSWTSEGMVEIQGDNTFQNIHDVDCAYKETLMEDHCADEPIDSGSKDQMIEKDKVENLGSRNILKCGRRGQMRAKHVAGFVCDICGKGFAGKRDIRDHVRVHYEDRPFICEHCGKRFKQSFTRTVHVLQHLKREMLSERKGSARHFTCATCGNQFANRRALNDHSIKHTNKFSCHLCEKCFSNSRNLRDHVRSHSTERPFICKVCQKSFNRKCNLKRHVALHTDVRMFYCSKCGKRFKTKHDLGRHELFHLQ